MGTPLTGSTVASTYTGLLKTSDNATITSSLKTLCDGSGVDSSLQVSTSAINSTGDFSVATNKFSVLSASGNASVAGTLAVTGAATLSSSLGVTGAATLSSTLGVTGATTLSNTLLVTGATTLQSTLAATGSISTSSNLTATGNLTVNGNSTLGDASADLLTINANNVTLPNITTQNVDTDTDKVIILDSTGKVRASDASQFTQNQTNSPQSNQSVYSARVIVAASTSGHGADVMSVTITPRSGGSKILVSAVVNYSFKANNSKNCVFRITRNGTPIGTSSGTGTAGIASASYDDSQVESVNNVKVEFLDSPNYVYPITYKIHVYGSGNMYLNYNVDASTPQSTTSTITVLEYFV